MKPTYYKIYYRNDTAQTWLSVYVNSAKNNGVLKDLSPDTKYHIYVMAYHGGNGGPKSKVITITTPKRGKYLNSLIICRFIQIHYLTSVTTQTYPHMHMHTCMKKK